MHAGTPPLSTGRCGFGNAPPIRCITAHNNCDISCSSDGDCSGSGTCEGASDSCTDEPSGQTYATFNSEQITNARTIIGVGKGNDIPEKGWEVALVTAMQVRTGTACTE